MIWLIARREIATRARTKAFQIVTALMFVGVIVISVLISVFSGDGDDMDQVTIGVEGSGVAYEDVLAVGSTTIDADVIVTTTNGRTQLDDGDLDVLFDGSNLIGEGFPDDSIYTYVRSTIQQSEFSRRATELGLSDGDLGALFVEVELGEERLDGGDDALGVRITAAMVSTAGTFMMLQVWGSFLMMGVVEEKASRVVEVLLSHISPRTLLTGKIIGLGALAFIQLLILVLGLAVGLSLVRDIEIPDGVWALVPVLMITFLLGYAFYATLFAAVGSTVSRQEDAQTAQLPAIMPLLLGYAIAVTSVSNPDTILVKVASYVPFTSPIVLPFRVAMSNPPWWEVGLALFILAASVPIMLRVAGAIYRTALLRTGTRVPLVEAFRNRSGVEL